jgi:hypothetical protein
MDLRTFHEFTTRITFRSPTLGVRFANYGDHADGLRRAGFAVSVDRFNLLLDGTQGPAEESGKISTGDILVSIDGRTLHGLSYDTATDLLFQASRPVELAFAKERHLGDISKWCTNHGHSNSHSVSGFVDYHRDLDEPLIPTAAPRRQNSEIGLAAPAGTVLAVYNPGAPSTDGQQRQQAAFMCPLIALGNIAVFVWSIEKNSWAFEPLSLNPMLGPNFVVRPSLPDAPHIYGVCLTGTGAAYMQVLYDLGAKDAARIVNGSEEWRLVTAMWLHAGTTRPAALAYRNTDWNARRFA